MWFLIRSAFWLGLTFSYIDWPGGAPTAPDARGLASAAVAAEHLGAACAGAPRACLDAARMASTLATSLPTPAPARRSIDTLKASDLATGWRGRN